jgi:hypothetical protein
LPLRVRSSRGYNFKVFHNDIYDQTYARGISFFGAFREQARRRRGLAPRPQRVRAIRWVEAGWVTLISEVEGQYEKDTAECDVYKQGERRGSATA